MTRYELRAAERQTYRRYAELALPRHTSYPIAPAWRSDPDAYRNGLAAEQASRVG